MTFALRWAEVNRASDDGRGRGGVPQARIGPPVRAARRRPPQLRRARRTTPASRGIVHRKGAVRAGTGDIVLIPGSMGTASYVGEGLGNAASFETCQHGAGRVLGRNAAQAAQDVRGGLRRRWPAGASSSSATSHGPPPRRRPSPTRTSRRHGRLGGPRPAARAVSSRSASSRGSPWRPGSFRARPAVARPRSVGQGAKDRQRRRLRPCPVRRVRAAGDRRHVALAEPGDERRQRCVRDVATGRRVAPDQADRDGAGGRVGERRRARRPSRRSRSGSRRRPARRTVSGPPPWRGHRRRSTSGGARPTAVVAAPTSS